MRVRPDERFGPKFALYHDVLAAAGFDETRARERFRRQIAAVDRAGFCFASMEAFLRGDPLGPRDVILTFDDAARSFLTIVWPVLREFDAPATMFVPTGFVGCATDRVPFLSWDELTALAAQGLEVGSHGVTHVPFDEIDRDRMRAEITDADAELRAHGFAPRVLAYPFGRADEDVKSAVRCAGYAAAFSVMKGGYDRFEIRRRLFTGLEGPAFTRFAMSDHFFEIRESVRLFVPSRFLKQEQPIAPERWGIEHFGTVVE